MAKRKKDITTSQRIANISSFLITLFMCAVFFLETQSSEIEVNYFYSVFFMIIAIGLVLAIINISINHHKLALNIPIVLFLFYTILMFQSNWLFSNYLLFCLAICAISCLYSNSTRTLIYILVQNTVILLFIMGDIQISGPGVSALALYANWAIILFGSIVMLLLTRTATTVLKKALEYQYSFIELLNTTENYVAMIDRNNEVIYTSKTLSMLSNVEEPDNVQGQPIIDLFPGKSLKLYAGKLLKSKDNYADDWEFTLFGQKRYFKAKSKNLSDESGNNLISLYDMTFLAERDEIAAMKDSMKIGLFFMDSNYVIQDHYSRFLEELIAERDLKGKLFTDILANSVSPSELESIKDYFKMVLNHTYDQDMLEEINPLSELNFICARNNQRKVIQCEFSTVERGQGDVLILVTMYDITLRIELQQKLEVEEARRQEEMQAVFELIQIRPAIFKEFMEDLEYEFDTIDRILKDEKMTAHEAVTKIYQSVHAIKSNAVILGLNIFGGKVHNLESKIKKLREIEGDIPFSEMLNLTMEIERISQEREEFKRVIDKLKSYVGDEESDKRQNIRILKESLSKAASRAAEDTGKKVRFVFQEIDPEALAKGPRRIIKEILMQLVRNSVIHGIEMPEARTAGGKEETGLIRLSISMTEYRKSIHIKLSDNGQGLDYKKIAARAIGTGIIKEEDADNKDALIKAIFAPGFSTADAEGFHAGRGIGLNLVRDRIKEANGTIKLNSEQGKGTVFLISIPVSV